MFYRKVIFGIGDGLKRVALFLSLPMALPLGYYIGRFLRRQSLQIYYSGTPMFSVLFDTWGSWLLFQDCFLMSCWLMLDGMELFSIYSYLFGQGILLAMWCHYMVMFGCALVDSLAIFHVFRV